MTPKHPPGPPMTLGNMRELRSLISPLTQQSLILPRGP
jgi:hypothetical protein